VIFKQQTVLVQRANKTILEGYREERTGLWRVQLNSQPAQPLINLTIPTGTIANTIKFLHQACCSPATSTFLTAIQNGQFTTWPMLTSKNVYKYLPQSEATAIGHINQSRKNTRSTKTKITSILRPEPKTHTTQTDKTYANVMECHSPTGQIYSNKTGRFLVQSSQWNKHIMIVYKHDSNAILAEPMKNRTEHEMIRAYGTIHQYLTNRGLKPKLQ
jgi:hypothetical protein